MMKEHDEPIRIWLQDLVASIGAEMAHRAVDVALTKFTVVELAAFATHWQTWGRSKQLPPATDWLSWGNLTARGFGKTKSIASHLLEEVQLGRARRIGLAAQNEKKCVEAQIGSLINVSPPWFTPRWEATSLQLVWPNDARALVFTPEVPGAIRSENFDLVWLSELQSWPTATREEAYSNFIFALRVGYARMLWDSTPKRGHPILKRLLAREVLQPDKHIVVRGTIYENPWLAKSAVADMEREYAGTEKGREELLGEMLEDSDAALVKQKWIDDHRREQPPRLIRRVIAIDPAVTHRSGSDKTGISDVGLTPDGKAVVLGDYTGKYDPHTWGKLVLDKYVAGECDLVIVETNKGGDLLTQNLRAAAKDRHLTVTVLDDKTRPSHVHGIVYVREIYSRGSKQDRAQPVSTAYERGRVAHVNGVDLTDLEETLTTWEPELGGRSPDRLDPLVFAVIEVLGLSNDDPNPLTGFEGIEKAQHRLATPGRAHPLASLHGRGKGTERI